MSDARPPLWAAVQSHQDEDLAACRRLLGAVKPPQEPEKSLAEWFEELTGIDLTACPRCGCELRRIELQPTPDASGYLRSGVTQTTDPIDSSWLRHEAIKRYRLCGRTTDRPNSRENASHVRQRSRQHRREPCDR